MSEILCTLQNEGFLAHYFKGTKEPQKAIIFTGGAACDEKSCLAMSKFLRDEGWNVLVLGFYLWKGLDKRIAQIPVDYAEKAIYWLKEKQGIEKIAMTGASTGGLYTLVCTSLLPDITCSIPVVPYDYVMEGTDNLKRCYQSEFTYHGEELPYVVAKAMDIGLGNWLKFSMKTKGYGLSRFMRYGYDFTERVIPLECFTEKMLKISNYEYGKSLLNPEARVKIENANADILLLASENDDCWPSEVAVRRIVEKLKEVGYSKKVEWHIYEKGSHLLVDGLENLDWFARFSAKTMVAQEKKYPKECKEAREDSFRRINKFLEEW